MRQFFGGYFHQDWDLMADDWQGLVDNYARDTSNDPPDEIRSLISDIEEFRLTHSEAELDAALLQTGASYAPLPPETYAGWLGKVAERLRQHAAAIEATQRSER